MIFWLFSESNPEPGEEPPGFLSPSEQTALAAKRFPKRRNEWLHGRWAAKQLLHQCHPDCSSLSLAQIVISTESGGAPYAVKVTGEKLPGCLSITHSGSLAAAALTIDPGLGVGIDLESIEVRPSQLFETYFTPVEVKYVQGDGSDDPSARLASIWSAKEAVLKAVRIGLGVDTRKVGIRIHNLSAVELPAAGWNPFEIDIQADGVPTAGIELKGDETWRGWQQTLPGYVISIAVFCHEGLSQRLEGQVPLQIR